MAFGTGTHPTTSLCVQLLEAYLKPGDTILDVGTGSGILMIVAAKLGAARIAGIDLDPMAVDVARGNLRLNGIDPSITALSSGNLVQGIAGHYDLVVANILAEVIMDLLDDVTHVVKPGGLFICSGIIEPFRTRVAEKMAICGFEILNVRHEDDWVAFVGQIEG